jgi:homoserine O-succinyltransferase
MPLVQHSGLPAFSRLREQGHEVLSLERALHQDIRELHIGFLNMMPDAALEATERQFIRLVGNSNRIAQFYVYPFSLPQLPRGAGARAYIREFYAEFEQLKRDGLDALIITGANVATPSLEQEAFWQPLMEVVQWADRHVASILCSCLATHAVLKHRHGIERQPLADKKWGVYEHRVVAGGHPLLRDINTRFDAPHSRHNDISRAQIEAAGLTTLAAGDAGGVHLATSADGIRTVYFQGHPEYDRESLLKEFRREVQGYVGGLRDTLPPLPEHYFGPQAEPLAREYLAAAASARAHGTALDDNLEEAVTGLLDNTWGDTAKAIFNNWLGLVYQVTNLDRHSQFMPGIDPDNPLGLPAQT